MKRMILMVMVAIVAFNTVNAQSAVELAKQQKELNKINMELLNSKPSKAAKKQAKDLKKQGWMVNAGDKTIEGQITEVQLLGEELMADENGAPTKRFIIQNGQSLAGSYNAARAAAVANAQNELGRALMTKIAAAMETKIDNQQNSNISATTVEKFHQRAKAIVDACLTNTRTPLTLYRTNAQNNYEVQTQVVFDKKELSARLKRQLKRELEQEGDEDLNDIVDSVLTGEL